MNTQYRPGPVARVSVVHNWLPAALLAWTIVFYGRRRFVFVWGWFFLIWLCWALTKFMIWASGYVAITAVFLFLSLPIDLATYPLRQRRANRKRGNAVTS